MDYREINNIISKTEESLLRVGKFNKDEELLVGVDLGTAYIVLVVMNLDKDPIACEMEYAEVLRDGLVIDYMGALDIVRRLKEKLEERLGVDLKKAAIAIPPGVSEGDTKTHAYIVEGAGFEVTNILDEPTAANSVLNLEDGVIVDIGGGTTGISIFENGEVVHIIDEPTGGTHLSLVVAGSQKISFEEAEDKKKLLENQRELYPIVRPVIQKMANIIMENILDYKIDTIHLVGGTCTFLDFEKVIEEETKIRTVKPLNPFLVTPIGIAMNC